MAEIAVITGRDPEHAHHVDGQHAPEILPAEGDEKYANRGQVQGRKSRDGAKPIMIDCFAQNTTRVEFLNRCLPGRSSCGIRSSSESGFQPALVLLAAPYFVKCLSMTYI